MRTDFNFCRRILSFNLKRQNRNAVLFISNSLLTSQAAKKLIKTWQDSYLERLQNTSCQAVKILDCVDRCWYLHLMWLWEAVCSPHRRIYPLRTENAHFSWTPYSKSPVADWPRISEVCQWMMSSLRVVWLCLSVYSKHSQWLMTPSQALGVTTY